MSDISGPLSRVAITVVATGVVIALLQFMQPILIPLVLSGLLFYTLDTPVDLLRRMHVPRALGAAIVLTLFVGAISLLVYGLQWQAMTVIDELPAGARRIAAALEGGSREPGALEKVDQAAQALGGTAGAGAAPGVVRVQVEQPRFRAAAYLLSGSVGVVSVLNQVAMVLFLSYFMLLSDQLVKRKLIEVAGPTLQRKKITLQIVDQIGSRIGRFLRVQILTSVLVAVTTWAALWALGLRQAALWGVIAGLLNSIPYYGPLVVTLAIGLVGFLQFGDMGRTLAVAGAALLITTLEGYLITPTLMGRAAGMNQVAVFVGLLFWSWAWGVWGLLLAVPMMMIVKVVCDHVEDLQPIGLLLGE